MKVIIALVLVIPTYGTSLLILFAYYFYKTRKLKPNIENAIEYLAGANHPTGMCFDEISYPQAIGYAKEVGQIVKQTGDYVEFKVNIKQRTHHVSINREPNGSGAILNTKSTGWIENIHGWLIQYMGQQNLPDISKIPSIKLIVLGSATHSEIYKNKITSIPADLCKISALEQLCLQNNKLTELPYEIGNLKNLRDLKLGGNALTALPHTIGNLRNLRVLTIWNNNLSEIPPEIGLLSNLKGLSLWGNPLTSLPEEITKLTQLKELELPNLSLSPSQKLWIDSLKENGCEVWMDDSEDQPVSEDDFDDDIPF